MSIYFCSLNLKGRDHLEDIDVDEKVILRCILENVLESWLDSSGSV